MRSLTVSSKLNIAIIGISITSLITASFILFNKMEEIKKEVYANTAYKLAVDSADELEAKNNIGITNAISISNDERIKKAFADNNRQLAIDSLKDISQNMRQHTKFKNIKVHLHTKNNHSFVRNWKLDKFGDDLSSFRDAIVAVNEQKKPIISFEPGRAGLLLRAITPIVGQDGTHYGSLEFIQGVNSVAKLFNNKEVGFLLLMDSEVNENMKTGKDFSFSKDVMFKDFVISQKFINKEFLEDAKKIDIDEMYEKTYVVTDDYFYTYSEVINFQGKRLGIVLLGKPLAVVNSTVNEATNLIYLALFGMFVMMIVINLAMVSAVRTLITNPLKVFENGLNTFFAFLQGKQDHTDSIVIKTHDEFGKMADALGENISIAATLHEEIQHLNKNLEKEVEIKTQEVTTLLDNAGQGFLSFNCRMLIDERYSKECEKLLGTDLAGRSIAEVLFIDDEKQKFFQDTIGEACQIDDKMLQETIISLLPKEIILNKRALKLQYKILENRHIMLIITNITAQKKLEKRIRKEQEAFKMIVEVISQSSSFYDTKRDYESFINNLEAYVNPSKTSLQNMSALFRIVHTFKGAFAQLYMNNTVQFLHDLESEISKMIKENHHSNEDLLYLLKTSDFANSMEADIEMIRESLGDEFLHSQNYLKIDFYDIKRLQETVKNIFAKYNLDSSDSKNLIQQVSSLSHQKTKSYLTPYISLCKQLAKSLDKEIYEFEVMGDDDVMIADEYKPFLKSLIHIFRNSLDHGLEDPETRLQKEKDEVGTISCSFTQENDKLEVIISDDGAGIDKEKVLTRALHENIVTQEEADSMSDSEIYCLIFNGNFSTKDEVSDLSGRGVGMDAVKAEVDNLNGTIEINTQRDVGTTFILSVPLNDGESE